MKLKVFLFLMLAAVTASSYAQEGGIRGKVVSRNGRAALSDVEVTIESLGLTARTNRDGEFLFENLPAGDYTVQFSTPEFEDLEVMVRVSDEFVRDLKSVVIVPTGMFSTVDGAVFAESDDDAVSDMQALPESSPRRRTCSAISPRTVSARCVSTSAVSMRSIRTSCSTASVSTTP